MAGTEKRVNYEFDTSNKQMVTIFHTTPIVEDEEKFARTHYFSDQERTIITTDFKNALLELFGVSNIEELIDQLDEQSQLFFNVGEGKMRFDRSTNAVIVYMKSFKENVVQPSNQKKRNKKALDNLSSNKPVSSQHYTQLFEAIASNVKNVELSDRDRNEIAKMIPKLIKEGKVKISLEDITDINKTRLVDIVQLGRNLLTKKIGVEKSLGIGRKHIGLEYAWQKYFELFGAYLLFGSINAHKPEARVQVDSPLRVTDSKIDILTINRYGFLDIIELKKSDEILFVLDRSHDNIVPSAKLSTAISQVNNYLMLLPHSEDYRNYIKGSESATGMLVFGSEKTLMSKDNKERYMEKSGLTEELMNQKIRKALRDLNYSYAHIQIVTYDDLLDNLENFLNQMSIEMNI